MGKNYEEWADNRYSMFKSKLSKVRSNLSPTGQPVPTKRTGVTVPKYVEELTSHTSMPKDRMANEELEKRILYDEKTGLYNLKTFARALNYELKRGERYKRPFSIAVVSIDGIDDFRKQYGEEATNYVLKCAGAVIIKCTRDVDVAARYDDTGFVILFPETNSSGITSVAERIKKEINAKPIVYAMQEYSITVSIGAAAFPAHARQADDLLAKALQAKEVAVERGGDRVCVL